MEINFANAQEECSPICTQEYSPVCGVTNTGEEENFSNTCNFEYNKCSQPNKGKVKLWDSQTSSLKN